MDRAVLRVDRQELGAGRRADRCDERGRDDERLIPTIDEGSYLYGVNFGATLRGSGVADAISAADLARGLKEGLAGTKSSTKEDRARLQLFAEAVNDKTVKMRNAAAQAFLDMNSHEKGVITTASGLQYKIIAAGDRKAASPKSTDIVEVQYRGKLVDGTEFDSSYARGAPAVFPVTGVIKGWQEALVLMKPGAKWQLFVPPKLGYGNATLPRIPGSSVLVFDVELLGVNAPQNTSAPAPSG